MRCSWQLLDVPCSPFSLVGLLDRAGIACQPRSSTKSKVELVQRARLSGIQKAKLMLQDEDAGLTRATFMFATLVWLVGLIVCSFQHSALGVFDSGLASTSSLLNIAATAQYGLVTILFLVYGVEKQARLCLPSELIDAVINMHNDTWLTFFDMFTLQRCVHYGTDLGTAKVEGCSDCTEIQESVHANKSNAVNDDKGSDAVEEVEHAEIDVNAVECDASYLEIDLSDTCSI